MPVNAFSPRATGAPTSAASADAIPADRGTVRCQVIEVRRCPPGKILALASVRLDMDGIELMVHGVQVLLCNSPTGRRLITRLPAYRTPQGEWRPALTLPPEVERPLGLAVIDACEEQGIL